jgi:hypothetical protein
VSTGAAAFAAAFLFGFATRRGAAAFFRAAFGFDLVFFVTASLHHFITASSGRA